MKSLKALFGLLTLSFAAIIITGIVLSQLGIEHGSLLIKVGFIFIIVNIILYLLLLIFFVCRHHFNLYTEKKRKVIGSKFRTKLVATFLGLVLIPSALMFFLANQLLNNTIDLWFSLEIQKPIYDSMDIARALYSKEKEFTKKHADLIASSSGYLDQKAISAHNTDNFKSYLLKVPDNTTLVKNAFKGTSGTDIFSTDQGDIVMAASPVFENGQVTAVVVVKTTIPTDIVTKMESIQKSFNDYIQIQLQQNPIRFLYFLMLTTAALVIIFLTLWISLRIAKGITVPIQSLAEATKTVAHGDMDFRIELERDDEIGMLINSFNKMLDDLQKGKQTLEKEYKESDRRRLGMETILESISTGVIFFDRKSTAITVNNAACGMLNIDRSFIMGKTYKELLEMIKSDDLSYMVKRLIEKGFGTIEKEIHIYIEGRPIDLRVHITVIKDSENRFIGTLVVFDNLTEVIMAQRALAWQEVAKRIAHEIKNPLTPIRLSAERVLKKWNDQAPDFEDVLRRCSKTIVHEVNSLKSLVDEFSRFGKMPKIQLEPTDIRLIIDEVTELYSNLKNSEVISSFEDDIPDIEIDRKQIKMALINLIDNAVQANTEKIWINTYYNLELEHIRIEVIDNGTGINEEDKDKLFFPYFSTKKEGTGLGLAIVNSIISKHMGYIRVQDNKPRGTMFIIELPVRRR